MNYSQLLKLGIAASCLSATAAVAQTTAAFSPPIGYNRIELPGNADSFVSVPFHQRPAHVDVLDTAPAVAGDEATLTPRGGGSWDPGEFGSQGGQFTHYVRFLSGAKEGFYYNVSGNTADALTVDTNGDDLSGVAADSQFQLIPHWTLDSVFPDGQGINVTTSPFNRSTEILFQDNVNLGVNKSSVATFFFFNSAWRQAGQPLTDDLGSTVIFPHTHFVVRNNGEATTLITHGRVSESNHRIQIDAGTSNNDNHLSIDRPIPTTLAESGIADEGFLASANAFNRGDELLVYDNASAGQNKPASATYFFLNGAWRKIGAPLADDAGGDVLEPGAGFTIRKKSSGTPETNFLNSQKPF